MFNCFFLPEASRLIQTRFHGSAPGGDTAVDESSKYEQTIAQLKDEVQVCSFYLIRFIFGAVLQTIFNFQFSEGYFFKPLKLSLSTKSRNIHFWPGWYRFCLKQSFSSKTGDGFLSRRLFKKQADGSLSLWHASHESWRKENHEGMNRMNESWKNCKGFSFPSNALRVWKCVPTSHYIAVLLC